MHRSLDLNVIGKGNLSFLSKVSRRGGVLMNVTREWRLMYINHGLKESHKRFHEYLNASDKQNSLSIVSSLSELLFWIDVSDEWHFKINNEGNKYKDRKAVEIGGQYIDGLRFVINSIKHEMSFIKLIKPVNQKEFIDGYYQMEDYSSELIWMDVDNLITPNKKTKTDREEYKKYIQGKRVVETVDIACAFLANSYFEVKRHSYNKQNN